MSTFMRGLVVGAFVGAAFAGSTIWRRRRDQAAKLRAMSATPTAPGAQAADGDEPGQNLERSTTITRIASPPRSGPIRAAAAVQARPTSPDQT